MAESLPTNPDHAVEAALVSVRLERIEENTSDTRDQLRTLVALEQKRDKREEAALKLAAANKAKWWSMVVVPLVTALVTAIGTYAASWATWAASSSVTGAP